jgi:MFS family permease
MSSRQRWMLVLVCTAVFMLLLDITVVSVALPSIQRDLWASLPDLQWVSATYALVLAVLLLPAATMGDRLGRRRLFLVGLVIFTAGSLACALAWTALARSSRMSGIASTSGEGSPARRGAVAGRVGCAARPPCWKLRLGPLPVHGLRPLRVSFRRSPSLLLATRTHRKIGNWMQAQGSADGLALGVPGSGTGQLSGLRGEGGFTAALGQYASITPH